MARVGTVTARRVTGRILATDTEIECDVAGTGTIFFHLACYDAWQSVLAAKE